jgi:hypothetical protein
MRQFKRTGAWSGWIGFLEAHHWCSNGVFFEDATATAIRISHKLEVVLPSSPPTFDTSRKPTAWSNTEAGKHRRGAGLFAIDNSRSFYVEDRVLELLLELYLKVF